MADLRPDTGAKLTRLLPRLASDSDGEVLATVAALRRTLDRAGLDLHDLAARLQETPRPVSPGPHTEHRDTSLFQMAASLREDALHRLTLNQRDFIVRATGLLAQGRPLTAKQEAWLRTLYRKHKGH